jgi:hypothetical protein
VSEPDSHGPAPARHLVFICFRSSDGGSYASVYLDEVLTAAFGAAHVFRSSRSIGAGASFPGVIEDALARAAVLLVLIGRDWLGAPSATGVPAAAGEAGKRAVDRPEGWVRHEIEVSLRAGIPVIPVLLTGATLPAKSQLPPSIADLADRQVIHLRHRHVSPDVGHLIAQIRRVAPGVGVESGVRAAPGTATAQAGRSAGEPRSRTRPFQALIAEKTRGFVGRQQVFGAVDDWLAATRCGYLTLRAEPGYGKSAIVARYTLRTGCLAYFNQRTTGLTRASQFLRSVREQLSGLISDPTDGFAPPAATVVDGTGLAELLGQAVSRAPGGRLVIAVDALDEVDLDSQDRGSNILYLPPQLPDGVYFLLTKRDVALPLVVDVPAHTIDLMAPQFHAANLSDARAYLEAAAALPGVARWLEEHRLTASAFVAELQRLSAANFIYLHHVVQDIDSGRFESRAIDRLPDGLQAYYLDHWHRMGMDSAEPPVIRLRVLYVLLEYQEPATIGRLASMVGASEVEVAAIIRQWRQFLRREDGGPEPAYSLYHESFADFLRREETLAASHVDLAEVNGLIADHLYENP